MYRNRLRRDTDVAAADPSIAQQAAGHELRRVDSDGKADSLGRQNRRRVHAHNTPRRIHQRPAGIAGIERGIRLNHVVDQAPGISPQGAPQRAHHARGHRGLKSVRAAERDHELSYAKLLRVAERRGSEAGLVYAHNCKIARGIVSDSRGRHAASVRQCDVDAARVMHHVAVRENQAVGSEDEAGAASATLALIARTGAACGLMNFDVDERRADALDRASHRARVSIEQQIVAGGPHGRRAPPRLSVPSIRLRLIHGCRVGRQASKNIPNFFRVHAG